MILKKDNIERVVDDATRISYLLAHGYKEVKTQADVPQDMQTAESTSYEELTNDELKALLDAREVQYGKRATKAQLIELLEG